MVLRPARTRVPASSYVRNVTYFYRLPARRDPSRHAHTLARPSLRPTPLNGASRAAFGRYHAHTHSSTANSTDKRLLTSWANDPSSRHGLPRPHTQPPHASRPFPRVPTWQSTAITTADRPEPTPHPRPTPAPCESPRQAGPARASKGTRSGSTPAGIPCGGRRGPSASRSSRGRRA